MQASTHVGLDNVVTVGHSSFISSDGLVFVFLYPIIDSRYMYKNAACSYKPNVHIYGGTNPSLDGCPTGSP